MSPSLLATSRAEKRQAKMAAFAGETASGELIRLENIVKTYHLGELDVPVLKGISLTIRRGEMVALMGASGSGKTTLMNILGCLDRPSSGQFWLDGQEMSQLSPDERAVVRTSKLGFVFQSFNLLPRTSAVKNVIMPLDYALHRTHHGDALRQAESLLDQVGLAQRCDHEPSQMSGGQQQRVAIARALVNRPALLLADEPTGNLDSHTGEEILRMFQGLNAQGITVILVTHDAKVAAYADRTIVLADGQVVDDIRQAGEGTENSGQWAVGGGRREDGGGNKAVGRSKRPSAPGLLPPCQARQAGEGSSGPRHARFSFGGLVPPTLRTALGNLRRNKLRSALTALGMIIGVGAVIAMNEIGEGSKAAVERSIASMGAHKLPIFPSAAHNAGVSQGEGTAQSLKPDDVDAIAQQCPAVTAVVPMVWAQAQVAYRNHNWYPRQLTGTAPDYLITRDWEDLVEGNNFTDADVRSMNAVCLIGETVKEGLFGDESPVNKMIRIRNVPFRVIGLLSRRGSNMMGHDQDDCVLTPWTTLKFRVNAQGAGSTQIVAAAVAPTVNSLSRPYLTPTSLYPAATSIQTDDTPQPVRQTSLDFIQAKADSAEKVPLAIAQITQVLRGRHHLSPDEDDDFKILDMTEIAEASAQSSEMLGTLLLIVAGISLVVGGVGIMNIMLVSVTERTREIGLRMAVGARRHHILQQFLVEAVVLCMVGGLLGILVGRGASILIREFQHWETGVSWPAILVSFFVAAGIGIVFGFYPAWKASRLDPIVALRQE